MGRAKRNKATSHYAGGVPRGDAEALLETASRLARLGYWVWDHDSNRAVFASRGLVDLYGLTVEEYLREVGDPERMLAWFHPDDRETYREVWFNRALKGKRYELDVRALRKDGTVFEAREVGEPVFADDGRLIRTVGTFQDITDFKNKERAARTSEERLRDFLEASADWIWEMDADLRFTFLSERRRELFGEMPIGQTRWELAGVDFSDPEWRQHKADLEARRPIHNFEYELFDQHGQLRYVSLSGKPIFDEDGTFLGYRGVGSDITARKQLEVARERSEARLNKLLHHAPVTLYAIEPHPPYGATFVSETIRHQVGHPPEAFTGCSEFWEQHIHPEDRARVCRERSTLIADGHHIYEYRFRCGDGAYCWLRDECHVIYGDDGAPAEIVGFWIDITNRKEAEARLYRQLSQRSALTEIGIKAVTGGDAAALKQDVVERVSDVLNADFVGISQLTDDGGRLVLHAGVGWRDGEIGAAAVAAGRRSPEGHALSSTAPVVVDDATADPTLGRPRLHRRHGIKSSVTVPVHGLQGPYGVLGVYARERGRFSDDEVEFLQSAVHILAGALARITAEERLRQNERRFRDFADAGSEWFWEMDSELRFTHVSERFTEVTGVPRSALLGRTREETGNPGADPAAWRRHLDDLEAHRPFRGFVHPRSCPDGKTMWLSVSGKPVFDDDGNFLGYRGTASDITMLMEAEQALRESEQRYRAISELTFDLIYAFRVNEDGSQSLEWSAGKLAGIEMPSYVPADPGSCWIELVHPDDHFTILRRKQRLEAGETVSDEIRVIDADGHTRWLVSHGRPEFDPETGRLERILGAVADVTAQREAEQAVKENEAQLRSIIDTLPGFVFRRIHQPDGMIRYEYLSPSFRDFYGLDPEEAISESERIYLRIPDEDRARVLTEMNSRARALETMNIKYRVRAPDGTIRWLQTIGAPSLREDGSIEVTGVVIDVTGLGKVREKLQYIGQYDVLTALPNRPHFETCLEAAVARTRKRSRSVAVLALDINRFKRINNAYGRTVGDEVLKKVARRLQSVLRKGDIVARMSADRFLLLLDRLAGAEDVRLPLQKIMVALDEPIEVAGTQHTLTANIGLSMFPADGKDPASLIVNAETALDSAKERGPGAYRFYLPALTGETVRAVNMERELRRGLENKEFELVYQPQIDTKTYRVNGVEALIRWRHPERGQLAPGDFLDVAHDSGLIVDLGDDVLRQACHQAAQWRQAGLGDGLHVSVNLAPQQLAERDVPSQIADLLQEMGLPPGVLVCELTEDTLLHNIIDADRLMKKLADMGIALHIDDFGTGYSSLRYLSNLPFTALKVDKSFVRDITTDPKQAGIVQTIIGLAHGLGKTVVAEGVETREQLTYLEAYNADSIQGYLFARPMAANDMTAVLKEGGLALRRGTTSVSPVAG